MGSCGKKGKDVLGRSKLEQPRGINWEIGIDICAVCLVAQSCPTLCDPMDCSLPGSSVHGIFWARILEWVATPFFKGSS